RFGRFMSRMRTAEWREGIAEVDELAKLANCDKFQCYRFAYAYSIAAGLVTEDNPQEKEASARRSVEYLRQAMERGFQGAADADRLKQDPEFNLLRDREDFKKLMDELEKS